MIPVGRPPAPVSRKGALTALFSRAWSSVSTALSFSRVVHRELCRHAIRGLDAVVICGVGSPRRCFSDSDGSLADTPDEEHDVWTGLRVGRSLSCSWLIRGVRYPRRLRLLPRLARGHWTSLGRSSPEGVAPKAERSRSKTPARA